MADYFVGPNADYASPQAALDALLVDVGPGAFSEQHNIIITNSAAYDGYSVKTLTPTLTNRLVITAATSEMPTILPISDGRLATRCIDLHSPYVTIERQEVRGGNMGLIARVTADGGVLKQMMFRDSLRTSIALRGADDFTLFNSVLYGANTCFIGQRVRGLTISFCTMKNAERYEHASALNSRAVRTNYPAASVLWISKLNANEDSVHIRNNNLVAAKGPVLATTEGSVDYIESDYNNLYAKNRGVVAIVPQDQGHTMTLEGWRTRFGQDENSISEDPQFYNAEIDASVEAGVFQDLRLKDSSSLRAKSEYDTDFDDYPTYVPDGDFTGDLLDVARTTPRATIGAYELSGNIYRYWDDILPGGEGAPYQDLDAVFAIAMDHYASVVTPWYPKIKTGFFWVRDNLYYLFSDKQSATLDQLRWFRWDFTGDPIPSGLTAYFDSGELDEDEWNIRGEYFYFKSAGYDVTGDGFSVEVSGEQLVWSSGDSAFLTGEFYWSSVIASGDTIFVLDPAPQDGAPIVITDTSISADDDTGELPFGFSVSYDEDIEQVVIEFQSGELPSERFMGYTAGDPYVLNDIISTFTWGAFALYGDYIADFPGLETFGVFTRQLDYGELSQMTIEWEGSATGIYEIDSLSMNPIHNPQTDGFLAIRNIHAAQWDRSLPSGESTLEDDWLAGRTGDVLPWARVTGKNKWHPLIREFSAPVPRVASISFATGELEQINSVPGPLVALQDTTGEEVLFTAFDKDDNPWAYEFMNFALTSTQGNDTGEFPGYIAYRQFGVYTKLGTSFDAETDVGGNVVLRYIPPAASIVSIYNPPEVVSGDDRWIETRYDIYPDNYGNPTILDGSYAKVDITGEEMSASYTGEASGEYYWFELDRYPYRGSVGVVEDGVRQQVIYHDGVQDGQVFVDYENKKIKSKSQGPATITFTPMLVWREPDVLRRYYLHSSFVMPDVAIWDHDAWIQLTATFGDVTQVHDIVVRNVYDTGDT